jgi:hypothetical protein
MSRRRAAAARARREPDIFEVRDRVDVAAAAAPQERRASIS